MPEPHDHATNLTGTPLSSLVPNLLILRMYDVLRNDKDPLITFLSKKIVQTGANTFDVQGDFTIRGVSKPETLSLTISGKGTGSGEIKGTMAFDRKDYGMTSSIPFIKIADRV